MCRTGRRSAMAANLLAEAGFSHVYSVIDGFEGDGPGDEGLEGRRIAVAPGGSVGAAELKRATARPSPPTRWSLAATTGTRVIIRTAEFRREA